MKSVFIDAFSLIELMVIIAIVAILATIAVTAYKNYILKSNILSKLPPLIDQLSQQAIDYAQTHGHFPTPADLGIAGSSGQNGPADYLIANASNFHMIDWDSSWGIGSGNGCGRQAIISTAVNSRNALDKLGFESSVTLFMLECSIWHINGTFERQCGFLVRTHYNHFQMLLSHPGSTAMLQPAWILVLG